MSRTGSRRSAGTAAKDVDPLYLLCFDHRLSYTAGIFNFGSPLSAAQTEEVSDSKEIIYQGFKRALRAGVPERFAGIVVDEQFGAHILSDANRRNLVRALAVEESGSREFEFEYGADFAHRIERVDPTFAKVLVRYNPEDEPAMDQRQRSRLSDLSVLCRRNGRRLLVELVVPPTDAQLQHVEGDAAAFAREVRPGLLQRSIRALQNAGVEPDVWAVEGPALLGDCERVVEAARHDGREAVGCLVLVDAGDEVQIKGSLDIAASVGGFVGFAAGRTIFWDAVAGYRARTLSRSAAAAQIAVRFRAYVDIFERRRSAAAASRSSIPA
jgi:myo-inositol catabolism protein IolC